MSSATAPARSSERGTTPVRGWLGRLDSPVTTYYLLVCVTTALVIFGLIMVLSASSIVSLDKTSSAYSIFLKQAGLRRRRGGRPRRRVPAVRARVEAPGPADPRRRDRRSSCSCSPRWASTSTATELAAARAGHGPALRDHQARARPRRWPRALREAQEPRLVHPRARALPRADRRREHRRRRPRARPRHRAHPRGDRRGGALRGRDPVALVRLRRGAVRGDDDRVRRDEPQPARPLRRLARPRHQRVRCRPPAAPRPVRPRRRRLVRPRSRCQPREVGPALGAAQRLHLRHHRRGARPARHARRPRSSSPASPSPATAS